MRTFTFLLFPLFLFSENFETKKALLKPEPATCNESFSYFRAGGISMLIIPMGGEVALGHRFRTEKWGYGPLINVSLTGFAIPAITIKMECLYFPSKWNGGYWGVMPGVGIGYSPLKEFFVKSDKMGWIPLGSIEVVFGREYRTEANKKRFYYFSFSVPCVHIFSFNYGWAF